MKMVVVNLRTRFDETLGETYLIPRISTEDLRTTLQIQTQTLDPISRSSAESFIYAAGYLKFRYQAGCSN